MDYGETGNVEETLGGMSQMPAPAGDREQSTVPEERRKLVGKLTDQIRNARDVKWADRFKKMRTCMFWAAHGADKHWVGAGKYRVNLIGRHIAMKVADLYAKNPTPVVKPRRKLDGKLWDGTMPAYTEAQMFAQMGDPLGLATLQEANQIILERMAMAKFAKTTEMWLSHTFEDNKPDFKGELKSMVRRALVTGVSFIRFDIYRTTTVNPDVLDLITDTRTRIAKLEAEIACVQKEDDYHTELSLEMEQLRVNLAAAELETEVVEQEGVIYTFPKSDSIIIDPACTQLRGFLGAGWVAQQRYLTPEAAKAAYGVDIKGKYQGYTSGNGRMTQTAGDPNPDSAACFWEVFDRESQTTYTLCDGYEDYVIEPHPPEVYREQFWPWLTFQPNETELEDGQIYPPSDVELLMEIQDEHNQSRQGMREHRRAARPIYVAPHGAMEEEETFAIKEAPSHGLVFLRGLQPGMKSEDILVPLRKHDLRPELYATDELVFDFQLTSGTQEANMGPVSGGTATESSIAEASRSKGVFEDTDTLDDFLTSLCNEVAKMCISALDVSTIVRAVGAGAVWPEMSRNDLAMDLEVKIKAGSSGRPNKAAELANMERIAPFLIQVPGINQQWLAEKMLERMEDDLDITAAFLPGMPSIVAQNTMMGKMQPPMVGGPAPTEGGGGAPPPGDQPNQQGAAGADQQPRGPAQEAGPQPQYPAPGA